MIVRLSHYDQQYALEEALEDFIAKCDRQMQWRAVEAAKSLHDQITRQRWNKQSARLVTIDSTPTHDG